VGPPDGRLKESLSHCWNVDPNHKLHAYDFSNINCVNSLLNGLWVIDLTHKLFKIPKLIFLFQCKGGVIFENEK